MSLIANADFKIWKFYMKMICSAINKIMCKTKHREGDIKGMSLNGKQIKIPQT